MADRTLPGIGLKAFWLLGENLWKDDMDANILKASSLVQGRVISQTTALPGSPTNGDIYIVPAAAGSHPNEIAVRDNGAWTYYTAAEGWRMFVVDSRSTMTFDGAAWGFDVTAIADISASAVASVAGDIVLDRASGEIKRISASGNITSIAFAGWPPADTFARIILELKTNGHTIALPDTPDAYWNGGAPPTVAADNRFVFFTTDGGTIVCAATAWQGTLP